ncbi:MAG TPA: DUF4105 domain-containing protein [Verrucomicrobiae bacterium]|jgi:hypothetical protein
MSKNTPVPAPKGKRRVVRWLFIAVGWGILFVLTAWATAALRFDLPRASWRTPVAVIFATAMLCAFIFVKPRWRALSVVAGGFLLVLVWWFTLKPSNTRAWQPDVAQTAWAEIRGDEVTLRNVRNCDYITETNYTPRWETRTVRFSKLTGIDIALTYWGSPWMAHPIVSFQFADAAPVAFSIETRKEIGESYSAVRGFFRQFELIYIVADERDVIRLRTNYRHGEEVFLYRTKVDAEQARARFREYIAKVNELHERPGWYNALTANCTTSIRTQRAAAERAPFDWRMILNGKSDEMAYERGALAGALPFAELKRRSLINPRAKAADKAQDFSRAIRADPPW